MAFPMIWRCAGDFFKVLLIFKMAATDQLNFFRGRKPQKKFVWSIFFEILTSHPLQLGDVQVFF